MSRDGPHVIRLETSMFRIPTDRPEADGTMQWDSTTVLVVEAVADNGTRGLGFTYCAAAAGSVVSDVLEPVVVGCRVDAIGSGWQKMVAAVRNIGRQGIAATAISAVDIALWDLRARCLRQPLADVLGRRRDAVPIYGSGGFTSYSGSELAEQLQAWVDQGIPRVKMKIGTAWGSQVATDIERVRLARRAIGPDAELFVDANGAYSTKQALRAATYFGDEDVSYFEEPVSSDHLDQLAYLRTRLSMSVAAGEYGYDPWYFETMLRAGAVDILQADVTRCLGVTGWLEVAQLAHAAATPFPAHTRHHCTRMSAVRRQPSLTWSTSTIMPESSR